MDNLSKYNNNKMLISEQGSANKHNLEDNIDSDTHDNEEAIYFKEENEMLSNDSDLLKELTDNKSSNIDRLKSLNHLLSKKINDKNNKIRDLENNIKHNIRITTKPITTKNKNTNKKGSLLDRNKTYISQLEYSITASEKQIEILRMVIKDNQSQS